MASLVDEPMGTATVDTAKSGKYDADYLRLAGVVSDYRKKISQISSECEECSQFQQLMD